MYEIHHTYGPFVLPRHFPAPTGISIILGSRLERQAILLRNNLCHGRRVASFEGS